MDHRKYMRRSVAVVIAVLALAALACGTTDGSATPVPATDKPQPTEQKQPTKETATEETKPTSEAGAEATQAPQAAEGEISTANVSSLHEVRNIAASTRMLLAAALSPDAPQGATFGADLYVRVWNIENGDMIYQLGPHAAEGWGLAYSPDGTKLATGGGFEVIMWDVATGKKIKSITVNAYVYRMNWSPDSRYLAVVGSGSSKIDLIDAEVGAVKTRISTPAGKVLWAAVYSPDGTLMAVGDFEGDVTVLDAQTSAIVAEDSGTTQGSAWDMEFSPNGKLLASCNGSGDIYFWDTESWAAIPELIKRDAHADPDPALSGCTDGIFSKSGDIYFSVGNNKVLNAWDTTTGKLLQSMTFNSPAMIVSISGDGKSLGVALADGSFHILGVK